MAPCTPCRMHNHAQNAAFSGANAGVTCACSVRACSGIVSMTSWQTYISFPHRRNAVHGTGRSTMTALSAGADVMSTVPNSHPMSMIARTDVSNPSTEDWVNVFGPNGYNVQPDNTRNRKLGRVHLPDVLKVGALVTRETRVRCLLLPRRARCVDPVYVCVCA